MCVASVAKAVDSPIGSDDVVTASVSNTLGLKKNLGPGNRYDRFFHSNKKFQNSKTQFQKVLMYWINFESLPSGLLGILNRSNDHFFGLSYGTVEK